MDYVTPVIPGGVSGALPGGAVMIIQGIEQHKPILTIIGLCVVGVGIAAYWVFRRRQRQDALAAGVAR